MEKWKRSGSSLLWHPQALWELGEPQKAVSLRQLFQISQQGWPEELPLGDGDALLVAGLDHWIDSLGVDEALAWLEEEVHPLLQSFQLAYDNQCALLFWIATPKKLERREEEERWYWHHAQGGLLPISRGLWRGTESDAIPIHHKGQIFGIYHPHIS